MTAAQFAFEDTAAVVAAAEKWRALSRQTQTPNLYEVKEIRHRGDEMALAIDALTVQYLELLSAQDELAVQLSTAQGEVDRFTGWLAESGQDEADATGIAQFVRWEHDRTHATQGKAWAVCPHEMCRAAGQYVR